MNLRVSYLVLASAMTLGAFGAAHAQAERFSLGIKTGSVRFSSELVARFAAQGADTRYEPALGFNVALHIAPGFSMELEHVQGAAVLSTGTASGEIDVQTSAAYAAYRTGGMVYLAARLGAVSFGYESDVLRANAEQTGASYSIGGGVRAVPGLDVELDYTLVEQDTSWAAISARYRF